MPKIAGGGGSSETTITLVVGNLINYIYKKELQKLKIGNSRDVATR